MSSERILMEEQRRLFHEVLDDLPPLQLLGSAKILLEKALAKLEDDMEPGSCLSQGLLVVALYATERAYNYFDVGEWDAKP